MEKYYGCLNVRLKHMTNGKKYDGYMCVFDIKLLEDYSYRKAYMSIDLHFSRNPKSWNWQDFEKVTSTELFALAGTTADEWLIKSRK